MQLLFEFAPNCSNDWND